jgi:hypothetical protein
VDRDYKAGVMNLMMINLMMMNSMIALMMTVQIDVVVSGRLGYKYNRHDDVLFGVSNRTNPITPYSSTRRHHLDQRQNHSKTNSSNNDRPKQVRKQAPRPESPDHWR